MATAGRFGAWLRTTRQTKGLTQRQLKLPAGTVAAYESGRRMPKTFQQRRRIAEALHVSLDALYAVLEEAGAVSPEDIYHLIRTEQWSAAYHAVQQLQFSSYYTGDTRILAEADHLLSVLTAKQAPVTLAETMVLENPLQALDWGSAALRSNQWISAWVVFQAVARVLPEESSAWGRLYNNIALTLQALGRLDEAMVWDARYIEWAERQHDAWRHVIAHALALLHTVLHDPQTAVIDDHVAVLQSWRSPESNQPDPLVTSWMIDAQLRVALAHTQQDYAHKLLQDYAWLLQYPVCQGEMLHFTDTQAQLRALDGDPMGGARLLRTALRDPAYRTDPAYERLEATQTLARLTGHIPTWRQLIQAYWALGAQGWIAHLLPEWQEVDPHATVDQPPLLMP